ncbi:MAG: F0F1 ATP synthase subunit gamma [Planctomycetes bacterium]|nr:F0F1 ATP synthase subunit gamma [Planctomycetota bacterium]
MKRAVAIERRLATLETLGVAVGAMKSLSAHHFRDARAAVDPAHRYREGIERVLRESGASIGPGDGPAGLLVVGGQLGLCGAYNVGVVDLAASIRPELGPGPTMVVGRRAALLLRRRNVEIDREFPGPTGVRGITPLLLRLAEVVLTRYERDRLSRFDIVSSRFEGVGVSTPNRVTLLPFAAEPENGRRRTPWDDPERLAAVAVREFLFITLYDLLLDALAAEQGARLNATRAAEQWIDDRSRRLRRELRSTRREASTQELIETMAAARATRLR